MDCPTLLALLNHVDDEHPVGPPPLPEHLAAAVEAGLLAVEEAADPAAELEFEELRHRVLRTTERARALRAEAAGLPPDDGTWDRLAGVEAELARLRSRLLDEAAARQARAPAEAPGPRHRLTWRGRETLDELQARAWRLAGVQAADFARELDELRQALRARAEGARRMDVLLRDLRPVLPDLDRRAVALSLAEPAPFPELERDRVQGLSKAMTRLRTAMPDPPPELAAMLAVHEHRDKILLAVPRSTPLQVLALALLPGVPDAVPEAAIVGSAQALAKARGAAEPGASDVVLAAAAMPPDRLQARAALLTGLAARVTDKDEAAAASGILLLSDRTPEEALARWAELDSALASLYQGPAAVPAALLSLILGPPEEVLDDLRLAAEEIERVDLAVSGLEALVQGVRLLLATATQGQSPRLLPTTSWAVRQVGAAGLQLRLPAAMASAQLGLLVDAAIYRQVRRSYRVYHRSHPAHRSGGFHG